MLRKKKLQLILFPGIKTNLDEQLGLNMMNTSVKIIIYCYIK